ncbi:hypothetical protein P7K49_005868, partial [Saguinus oedipus]
QRTLELPSSGGPFLICVSLGTPAPAPATRATSPTGNLDGRSRWGRGSRGEYPGAQDG